MPSPARGPDRHAAVDSHRRRVHVAGVRNLTQVEAAERARLLEVTGYDITLDLTDGQGHPGDGTFRSTTVVTFTSREPGAETFIETAAHTVRSATLNGRPID